MASPAPPAPGGGPSPPAGPPRLRQVGAPRRGQGRGAARGNPERSGEGETEPAGCGGAREAGVRAARKRIGSLEVGRWMVEPGMVSVLFNKKPTSITKPQIPSLSRNHRRQHLCRCARTVTRRGERRHACVTSRWCSAVRVVLHHRRGSAGPKA